QSTRPTSAPTCATIVATRPAASDPDEGGTTAGNAGGRRGRWQVHGPRRIARNPGGWRTGGRVHAGAGWHAAGGADPGLAAGPVPRTADRGGGAAADVRRAGTARGRVGPARAGAWRMGAERSVHRRQLCLP